MTMLRSFLAAMLLCLCATAAQAVPSITVAPGSLFGYVPLDLFGVTPTAIGDEDALNFDVPGFVYAGQTWNRIGVTSNGYAIVGGTSGPADISFNNTDLPDPSAPKNILAPLWTDLDGTGAPGIFATTLVEVGSGHQWFVIEWRLNVFGTTALNTFQAWIGLNGVEDITFTYGELDLPAFVLDDLTVGANDISGTVGDPYYYNGAGTLPAVGTDLRVTTRDLPVAVPEPATLALLGAGLLGVIAVRKRRRPV